MNNFTQTIFTSSRNSFKKLIAFCSFLLVCNLSYGQTVVTVGGGASVTCPTTPTATWTTPPTGVTFSNWSRGSGVNCASANNALSGGGFTSTSADASITANKFYRVTITANASTNVNLSNIVWNTTVSGTNNTCSFAAMYSNNGGAVTQFGTTGTNTTSNTFTGSVSIAAGTSLVLYMVPFNVAVSGTTVRWLNGSKITVTATAAAIPTISATGPLSAVSTTYGTASSNTTFNVSGANMTAGILVTPPAGFQVSTTSDFSSNVGSNGAPITVGAAGTIASTPVYVRLASTTIPGTYSGNIVLSSSGASNVNVATVSSTVSTKNLTISGLTGNNKVYDGSTTVSVTGTAEYIGLENGESFTPSGSVTWAFPNANVETNKVLTRTGSYSAPSLNYTVTQPSLTANITPKALTITADNVTKTAGFLLTDGAGSTAFSSVGLVGSEAIGSVSMAYGSAGATTGDGATPGVYPNQVTPSAATAGTFSASNYTINYISGSITVEQAPANPTISVSGSLSGLSTTYGASSTSTSFTVSGAAMNEGITITPPVGFEVATSSNFSTTIGNNSAPLIIGSAGIIANTTIYVRLRAVATVVGSPYSGNITLTSTDASPQSIVTSSSTVSEKNLIIIGLAGANKVYDGSTTATVTGTAAYDGLVNNESFVIVGTPSYSFTTAAIGIDKTITVTGFEAPSSNYTITQPSLLADISAKALTITGASASNKTYDRTNTATISGGTLEGIVSPDAVVLSQTGTFAQIGIGTAISVTSSSTLGGADAGNYTLTQPTGLSADITPKVLTITSPAATNKIYDATTTATISGTLNGIISPDAVTLTGSGTFAQATIGSGIAVTSTSTLGGTNAGNYSLTQPTGLIANITVKTLSITAASVASKTYDVSTTSGPVTAGTLSGFVGSETVSVSSATGTFANANVGTGKTATIVYTLADGLNGGLATNYSLANTTASGNITAKSLSITAATIASKIYNGTTATGTITAGTLTGFVGSETVGITSVTGVYQDANVGTGKSATITYVLGNGSNGGLAANYALSTSSANGDITAKSLTVTANNVNKEIGTTLTGGAGSTAFTSSGLVSGQTIGSVTITYGNAATSGAAIGTYTSQITPSLAIGGTFITSNYSITYVAGDIIVENTTAIVLTNIGAAVIENFDIMASSGTASLPIGIRVGNDFSTATSNATLTYGTSGAGIVGSGTGGIINWANGVTAAATDRALGFLNTGSFTSPRSIVVSVLNTTGNTINSLEIDWDYEKYRSGSRAFNWTFFHGNITNPSTATTEGNQSYSADANSTTVFNPPTAISKTVILNNLSIESGQRYYFLWTFTGVGGSSNGQGIGIDNLSIKPCVTTLITSQPSTSAQSTCLNGTSFSALSVAASGTDLVFQWQQSGDGSTGWISAVGGTGSTTNSFTPSNVSAGTNYYRCVITNGCGEIAISGVSGAITVSSNNNWIGTGGLWSDDANWSCGSVPLGTSNITISSGTPTLDENFTVGNSGSLTLNGTASLIITPNASLTIEGTAEFNGRPVTFKSDNNGTAAFGTLTGTLNGATNVTTERYFKNRRAYRITSSSVTTTSSIKANWQEDVNNSNTTFSNNQNPNPGYGTHITGTGGSANGFDTTISNVSSLFTYNNSTSTWTAVSNTNSNTLNAGVPYRINIRGDRSIDLSITNPPATQTTLRANGTLYTGPFNPANLNATAYAYNLVGNPYQAPVNMKSVLDNSTNVNNTIYYVWEPRMGQKGAYISVDINTNTPNNITSASNKFLQPGQACFIRTAATGGTPIINFQESYKDLTASNNLVFKNANQSISTTSNIKMRLYDSNSLALNQTALDGSIVFFDDLYNNGVDQNDGAKFTNPDEMFSTFNNGALISIEKRMPPTSSDIIPIRISQYRGTNYTIIAQGENLNGIPAYLHDQFLQTYTEIPQSGSVNYPYTVVTTNTQTTATDRFRIVYSNPLLSSSNNEWKNFTLYPNPSKQGNFNIILGQPLENGKITIYNTLGEKIYKQDLVNTIENSINPKQNIPTGIYYVEIQNGSEKSIKKLIIE